jgi:hypothetical protein
MNISHLEYLKTLSTCTWTNSCWAMTNHGKMIIRKHATRQHNLPDIPKTSSWRAVLKVPKLFEQTTYLAHNHNVAVNLQGWWWNVSNSEPMWESYDNFCRRIGQGSCISMGCLVNMKDITNNSRWIITEKCVWIYIIVLLLFIGLDEVAPVKNCCSKWYVQHQFWAEEGESRKYTSGTLSAMSLSTGDKKNTGTLKELQGVLVQKVCGISV